MDFYTIYESDEMKVTIPMVIHEFFKKIKIKKKGLSKGQFNLLLSYTLSWIERQGEVLKGREVKSSSELPVVEKDKPLSLYEPFDIFEQGFGYLAYAESKETLDLCMDGISELYEDTEHMYFHMFAKPIFDANGFFAFIGEKDILIAFFTLAEWENIESE